LKRILVALGGVAVAASLTVVPSAVSQTSTYTIPPATTTTSDYILPPPVVVRRRTTLTAKTRPKSASRRRATFTTTGRLGSAGYGRAACHGFVRVSFKQNSKTVSARLAAVRNNCTYRSRVHFKSTRLHRGRVDVVARFAGNERLFPASARRQRLRVR